MTGARTFDAAKDDVPSFSLFANEVLRRSGAPDFQKDANTLPIDKMNLEAGGIFVYPLYSKLQKELNSVSG